MNLHQLNIFNEPLEECSNEPKTGFFRTGCCETDAQDIGTHTVCAIMDKEFLQFSFNQGNDLITPAANFDFPGLKPGDRWCLCADRWIEALNHDIAPNIILESTHIKMLDKVDFNILKKFGIEYMNLN